ncbi:hypothetical protein [Streptomyces avermitilis]|uniref:Uncharacterized protein n=1 Tax=Streptomyces avermitilis TaxID=33903 RepID=A0A4D4MAK7_STRAX|nr:hypothetical protein [Streptomyces avermitilis]GDY68679.1 hypothetical protein SAV14893_080720 [Streptomyces avermitilis]
MTSLRFPPVSDTASGMPWPSVRTWCLPPGRARPTGLEKRPAANATDRSRPLAGMASSAANNRVFIGKISRGQKAERARLEAGAERAESIAAAIDAARSVSHGRAHGQTQ